MSKSFRLPAALVFSLWLLLVCAVQASAGEVADLYQAEAPVADQESAARNQAIASAFAEVLVKVSGDRAILGQAGLATELGKAGRYVQQYSYLLEEPTAAGRPPERRLRVRFDPAAVDQVLRRQGLPVWGSTRPTSLVWLAIEDDGRRRMYSPERDDSLRRVLQQAAARRGIPALFPLMDLEDQGQLRASDLWGGFDADIRRASARYQPDAVLVGRLAPTGVGGWRGDWSLAIGDNSTEFRSAGGSVPEAVVAGVDGVADLLAARFAPRGGDAALRLLRVRVTGIDDVDGFARARNYLRGLSAVEDVYAVEADPGSVLWELKARGGPDDLQRAIALGEVLARATAGDNPGQTGAELNFQLRP